MVWLRLLRRHSFLLGVIFLIFMPFYFSVADVTFETKKIKVGRQPLNVEIAQKPEQLQKGLMFRKELKDGFGMLFIFDRESPQNFWMKNTFIPLSIGFFDSKKVLVDIQDMQAVTSELDQRPPSYTSRKPAQYALEVPQGWFKKNKVDLGSKLEGL